MSHYFGSETARRNANRCGICGETWKPATMSSPAEGCDCREDAPDLPQTRDEAIESTAHDDYNDDEFSLGPLDFGEGD